MFGDATDIMELLGLNEPAAIFVSCLRSGFSFGVDSAPRTAAVQACSERAMRILSRRPHACRVVVVDDQSDGENFIVSAAIRGAGTCEMLLPRESNDLASVIREIGEYAAKESSAFLIAPSTGFLQ